MVIRNAAEKYLPLTFMFIKASIFQPLFLG